MQVCDINIFLGINQHDVPDISRTYYTFELLSTAPLIPLFLNTNNDKTPKWGYISNNLVYFNCESYKMTVILCFWDYN